MEKLAFNTGIEDMKTGCQRRQVERVGYEGHFLALDWSSHKRGRPSGSSRPQQDQVCRAHEEPASTPSTFWESSLQGSSNLLPSAEAPSAGGGHLRVFVSSAFKRVLYFEMAMSSESTNVKRGELGNFPQKHFAD